MAWLRFERSRKNLHVRICLIQLHLPQVSQLCLSLGELGGPLFDRIITIIIIIIIVTIVTIIIIYNYYCHYYYYY